MVNDFTITFQLCVYKLPFHVYVYGKYCALVCVCVQKFESGPEWKYDPGNPKVHNLALTGEQKKGNQDKLKVNETRITFQEGDLKGTITAKFRLT